MEIMIVREPVTPEVLAQLAAAWHETFVKGAADTVRGVIALGGQWHANAADVLIADGSKKDHVWGYSLYPQLRGDAAITYRSHINIRPLQGNTGIEIQDERIQHSIRDLAAHYVPFLGL